MSETEARNFLIQKFPLVDATGNCWGLGVIATDITECKLQEMACRQRLKLESLGLLAGGIAHDFNNILGAMLGNLELARLDLCPPGTATALTAEELSDCLGAHLQTLEELVTRATTLVAQILAYAGKGKFQLQALDLNLQVEQMLRILQASLSSRAMLRLETTPNLPPMEGDAGQINQVIMNLILNASEAMEPRGGAITIRTGLATLTQVDLDHQYQRQDLQPGVHLVLEVSDQGPGVPPEVQERIFEPFFTTKFTGRGLGLSAVQGILRSHQGCIQVVSEEGKGATFKILIPASPGTKAKASSPALPAAGFRGSGTVLVVDDEAPLRTMAVAALRRMGFETVEAGDGLEALQVFEANRDRVVLILMDLTMPRMNGEEAYRHLRRAGAMVPILLSSGFGQEEALRRFRGKVLAGFLQKPYRFQALVDTIRSAMPGLPGTALPRRLPMAWVPEFETGHPIIDGQHQEILQVFNQVVAAAEGGEGEVKACLARLIELTIAHFGVEEALMGNADDAGLREHRTVHAQLSRQLRELAGKIDSGETTLGPPVFDYMEEWLLCHIELEDKAMVRWLKGEPGHYPPDPNPCIVG